MTVTPEQAIAFASTVLDEAENFRRVRMLIGDEIPSGRDFKNSCLDDEQAEKFKRFTGMLRAVAARLDRIVGEMDKPYV